MASAKQLKAIRKKFHLGEFRKTRSSIRKYSAKVRTTAKRKGFFKKRNSGAGSMLDNGAKGLGYAYIAKKFTGSDLIAMVAGYYGGGVVGVIAPILTGVTAMPNLGGLLGNTGNNSSIWN